MKSHCYLIYRQEKFSVTVATAITATTDGSIQNDEELKDAIRDAATEWVRKTSEGRDVYSYGMEDTNIGDLCDYLEDIIEYAPGIHSIKAIGPDIAKEWTYDSALCDDIEEDAYESSS